MSSGLNNRVPKKPVNERTARSGIVQNSRGSPPEQTGELRLAARASLVVERIADGPQVGGGQAAISLCRR